MIAFRRLKKTDSIIILLTVLSFFVFAEGCSAEWKFDWTRRADMHGKPAGIFTSTPFPITETTDSYTMKNDEYPNGKTYYLGQKFYVDATLGLDTNDGLSLDTPKKTIQAAVATAGSGNKTIIVRRGGYPETGILLKPGLDDTHRFMIVGYGQERPVINGESTVNDTVTTSGGVAYATVQRLQINNNYRNGVRTKPQDSYINVIDVGFYNNDKWDAVNKKVYGDGNLYFLGSDNCYISHCTSEHTFGHAFKVGDGADQPIVEWSVARYFGFWPGFPLTAWYGAHASGFDFPNDSSAYVQSKIKLRYNIVHTGLYYAIQIRTQTHGGHEIKYNEVYNTTHFADVAGSASHAITPAQVIIYTAGATDFFNNIVRNAGEAAAHGILVSSCSTGPIKIYNNIVHSNNNGIHIRSTTADVNVYNNTLLSNNNGNVIDSQAGDKLTLINNFLHQRGTGKCLSSNLGIKKSYNRYFAAAGAKSVTLAATETYGDPKFTSIPTGALGRNVARPATRLLGKRLAEITTDFNGTRRRNWSIGAIEY